MKKSLAILFLSIILLSYVSAQTSIRSPEETFEKYVESVERLRSQNPSDYTSNLQNRLQNEPIFFFLHSLFSFINKIFNFLSPLFSLFFREAYSLSPRFFIIFFLWLFIFIISSKILKDSFIEGFKGYIAGFIIAWLVGLSGTYHQVYFFAFGFIDMFSGSIRWLIILVIIIVLIIITKLIWNIFSGKSEKIKKEQEKIDRERLHETAEVQRKFAENLTKKDK